MYVYYTPIFELTVSIHEGFHYVLSYIQDQGPKASTVETFWVSLAVSDTSGSSELRKKRKRDSPADTGRPWPWGIIFALPAPVLFSLFLTPTICSMCRTFLWPIFSRQSCESLLERLTIMIHNYGTARWLDNTVVHTKFWNTKNSFTYLTTPFPPLSPFFYYSS